MHATRRLAADGGERPSSPGRRSGWVMLAQPDPGDAGAGGEQPRQRRDASCPADRCAPNRSRCSSMNAQINGAVGRIAARRKLLQPLVFRRPTQAHNFSGVTCGSRGLHRGDPGRLTGVDLGLAHQLRSVSGFIRAGTGNGTLWSHRAGCAVTQPPIRGPGSRLRTRIPWRTTDHRSPGRQGSRAVHAGSARLPRGLPSLRCRLDRVLT
jgi:hypothetical protein